MLHQPREAQKRASVAAMIVATCLAIGLSTRASAECASKTYKKEMLDPATLKDGEQSIGSIQTLLGSVEVRAVVKSKVASAPRFFLGGQQLTEVAPSALPSDLRECLKNAPAHGASPENWFAKAARSAADWVIPSAEAAAARPVPHGITIVFTEVCFKGTKDHQTCTYTACVSDSLAETKTCAQLFATGK